MGLSSAVAYASEVSYRSERLPMPEPSVTPWEKRGERLAGVVVGEIGK